MAATARSSDTGQCVLTGNVHITQGTLDIQAGRAVVHRANGDIRRVQFAGSPVQLTQELDDGTTMNARAQNVDYDMATETVVFTGDALIDQPGRGNISGGRIVYNMKSGQVQGSGEGDKGRVQDAVRAQGASAAGQSLMLVAKGCARPIASREVVRDFGLTLDAGEVVGLLGPNGAGKTTCFYMIVGLVPADAGQIVLDGRDITGEPMYTPRQACGVGYLPQEPSVFRKLSVADNIRLVLELREDLDDDGRERELD